MARISVIVPTLNRVEYLEQTIASVLSQDHPDFELIVADNASTDGTAALLANMTDSRLRHVRRAHDVGWRTNFNQALHDAASEYVALVADDDRLLPGALTRASRFLDEAPSVGLVHTTFHVIDDRGELITADGNWSAGPAEDHVQRGADFIAGSMSSRTPVCLSSVVMRTAALPEVCFDAADEVAGDFVLFLRIALDWDVGFLATPGVELRIHPGQISNAFDLLDNYEALRESKLRYLSANSARLDDLDALRRAARGEIPGYSAAAMSRPVSIAASGSRADGIRALRRAVRLRPRLLLAPRIWRAAVKIVLGPRVLRYLRGLRAWR